MERVSRAFLFHEDLATQDEGASLEEALEHVLWYFPSTASRPERLKHVGLSQALLSFSDRFEQQQQQQQQRRRQRRRRRRRRRRLERPHGARDAVGDEKGTGKARGIRGPSSTLSSRVEVVRTSRHCHGFLECEPGVWLVMVLANRRRQHQQQQEMQQERQQWQRPRRREGGGFLGGGEGVGGRGGEAAGAGAGAEGDWVDELALREAMSRAYETFALMHGSVSDALRAPVTIQPNDCSSDRGVGKNGGIGIGVGGTVSGFEVLRRLASARKRLRKAKIEAGKVPQEISGAESAGPEIKDQEQVDADVVADADADADANGDVDAEAEAETLGGRGQQQQQMAPACSSPSSFSCPHPSASSRPEEKLAGGQTEEGDNEVAALLRASPAKAVRESLQAFFAGYLPGVGLAEPHFHLDMGYPQSLPTDLYRRQLGLRIQRRVRKRIRSLLGADSSFNAASDVDFDIDIAVTLGAGALMLAGMDPEPPLPSPSIKGDAASCLKGGDGAIDDDRRKDGAKKAGGGGEEENGSGAQQVRGNVPESPRVAEESPEVDPGNKTRRVPRDEQWRLGEGDVLEGREAALLMEYLGAAAFTAAGKQATAQAPPAPVGELSAAAGANAARASLRKSGQGVRPTETKNPRRTLWAALRSEAASGYNGGDAGLRSVPAASLAGPSGLLRLDGSLAPCGGDGSAPHPADDLSDCAIWAPELHRMKRQSTWDAVGVDQEWEEEEQERSTVLAAVPEEIRRRRRLRRSVVAYVRGGLCALVAFRDLDEGDPSACLGGRERSPGTIIGHRSDPAGTCASPRNKAEGEAVKKASPREGQEKIEAGRELGTSRSKVPGRGWKQLELLSLGRAIETSLSEDPDLGVLEDDVRDFYFQSAEVVGAGSGRERQRNLYDRDHNHSPEKLKLIPGPVRAVHHQSFPFPCFAGVGLVHHPVAPTHQTKVSTTNVAKLASAHVYVPEGAGEQGTEDASSTTTTTTVFESSLDAGALAGAASFTGGRATDSGGAIGDSTARGSCRCSGKSGCWLMIGGQKRPFDGCGVRDISSGSGREFVALIQVFGQKGRPDIGVKGIRRRGLGGEQELAAFDDIHVRLKLHPAAVELGIRTSMSKGHRWVIGRLQRASRGDDSCSENVEGEMYATIEAPVLSVGDARAAAGRIISGTGADGNMSASHGAGRSRAQVAGLGRRRYLR